MQDLQQEAFSACESGQVDQLRRTLANMNDVDRKQPDFFLSMLHTAAHYGQVTVVQCLVSQDTSFKVDRETAVVIAGAKSRAIYEAVYTVDPDFINLDWGHGGDAILAAVTTNNIEVLSFLLDKKADVNAGRWLSKRPAIAVAAFMSTEEIVTALVHHGAKVSGSNALQEAASHGRLDVVRCLVDLGADVNDTPNYTRRLKPSDDPGTPLHSAARTGNLEIVRYLLDHGANAKLQDSEGKTVLDVARCSQKCIIKLLIIKRLIIELLCTRNT